MNEIDLDIERLRQLANAPSETGGNRLDQSVALCKQQGYPLKHVIALARSLVQLRQTDMLRELLENMPAKRLQTSLGLLARLALAELDGEYPASLRSDVMVTLRDNPPVRFDAYLHECVGLGFQNETMWRDLLFAVGLASGLGIGELITESLRQKSSVLEWLYWDALLATAAAPDLRRYKSALQDYLRRLRESNPERANALTCSAADIYVRHGADFTFSLSLIDQFIAAGEAESARQRLLIIRTQRPNLREVAERLARLRLAAGEPMLALLDMMPSLLADSGVGKRPGTRDLLVRALLALGDSINAPDDEAVSVMRDAIAVTFPESDLPLRAELQAMKRVARISDALPLAQRLLKRSPKDPGALREYGMILRLCNRPLVEKILARRRRQYASGSITSLQLLQNLYAFERQRELIGFIRLHHELTDDNECARLYQLALFQSGNIEVVSEHRDTGALAAWHLGQAGNNAVASFRRLTDFTGLPATTDTLELAGAIAKRFADTPPQYEPVPGRVLVVAHSLGIGGCERQIQYLLDHAPRDQYGFQVAVKHRLGLDFAIGGTPIRYFDELAEVEAPVLRDAAIRTIDLARVFRSETLPRLVDAILTFRPEIVHFTVGNVVETLLASLLCGVPRTLVQFGSMHLSRLANGAETGSFTIDLIDAFGRALSSHPRFIFAVNAEAAIADWTQRWNTQTPLSLISNAFTEAMLARGELNSAHAEMLAYVDKQKQGGKRVVGSVFRMDEVKNPWLWFRIVRDLVQQNPSVIVVHCGNGPARFSIARLIARHGLQDRILLAGIVTDGLQAFYQRFDVFLLTSHTECLPNVVLEAQINGVPVVAPKTGGIAEGVVPDFATLIAGGDASDFCAALLEWLDTTTPRKPAVTLLAQYTPERMIGQTVACYAQPTLLECS
jgi:glycosyltransferase involved in cell wall biosynthesis